MLVLPINIPNHNVSTIIDIIVPMNHPLDRANQSWTVLIADLLQVCFREGFARAVIMSMIMILILIHHVPSYH